MDMSPLPLTGFIFWPILCTHGHWAVKVFWRAIPHWHSTGDPDHLHNIWHWNCHYLSKRLKSVRTGNRTPNPRILRDRCANYDAMACGPFNWMIIHKKRRSHWINTEMGDTWIIVLQGGKGLNILILDYEIIYHPCILASKGSTQIFHFFVSVLYTRLSKYWSCFFLNDDSMVHDPQNIISSVFGIFWQMITLYWASDFYLFQPKEQPWKLFGFNVDELI